MKKCKLINVLQEKTISDLWRIAQKKNCDDFIKIVKELNIVILYKDV